MICYKVVSRKYRYGTNATGHIAKHGLKAFQKKLRDFSELKQFFPLYKKGEVVKAVPESIGILCFKTKAAAKYFISMYPQFTLCKTFVKTRFGYKSTQPVEIIKVFGSDEKEVHRIMAGGMSVTNLITSYNDPDYPAPKGTICFESIKVLE